MLYNLEKGYITYGNYVYIPFFNDIVYESIFV